jgi:hypothetical protein
MTIHITIDAQHGLSFSGHISTAVLRILLAAGGVASLPWLAQLGHALGWL